MRDEPIISTAPIKKRGFFMSGEKFDQIYINLTFKTDKLPQKDRFISANRLFLLKK